MKCFLDELNESLVLKRDLSELQVHHAIDELIDDDIELSSKKSFLSNLALKGETTEEFNAFAGRFHSSSRNPGLDDFSSRAVDLCGTGGDRFGSFNVSTFVSIMLAAAGIPVIKHGNRSISSKCGSADLLEAIGIRMETDEKRLKKSLEELNFCFLFAPFFHPAFKHLAATRKALAEEGVLTVFNRLGPCLNPARPAYQLLGVYDPFYLVQIAQTLEQNGGKAGWVVHGIISEKEGRGVDELTSCGPNLIQPYGCLGNKAQSLAPPDWGQVIHAKEDLLGGTVTENLSIMKQLLEGRASAGLTGTVIINAGSALYVMGKVKSLKEGTEYAEKLLLDGKVVAWLDKARVFFS